MSTRPLVLLLSVPLLLAGCDSWNEGDDPATETDGAVRRRDATRVRVAPAERREMVSALETTTNLQSERRVSLSPRSSGEVIDVVAEEGDFVEVGALLAKLDPRDAEVALEEARVARAEAANAVDRADVSIREAEARIEGSRLAYDNAEAVYQRNEGENLISAQDFDQLVLNRDTARSEWEQAKLALETARIDAKTAGTNLTKADLELRRAELNLTFTELRAPFDGTIAQRNIRLGDLLSTTDEAFVLTDLEDLRAEFYRPQRELALFTGRLGEDGNLRPTPLGVSVEAEALPDFEFHGEILRVSPDIDPTSGSFRVTVDVAAVQHGLRLLPGMLVRLKIVTERHPDALVVSKRALRREGDTSVIFVVRDGRAMRTVVDESFSDDEFVEVIPRSGFQLEAGEPVVIVGNRDLEDGDEVNVSNEADEATTDDAPADTVGDAPADAPADAPDDAAPNASEDSATDGQDPQAAAHEDSQDA